MEFVEELGAEVIVHTRVDGLVASAEIVSAVTSASDEREIAPVVSNLIARLPGQTNYQQGATITLYIDPAAVHCFDPDGPTLRRGTVR